MAEKRSNHGVRTNMNTGCRALDDLLDQAPPQALAAMYVASKLAASCGQWNGLMADVLRQRAAALREQFGGDSGADPDDVFVRQWLSFAEAFEAGIAVEQ